jgi:hypothetical protein
MTRLKLRELLRDTVYLHLVEVQLRRAGLGEHSPLNHNSLINEQQIIKINRIWGKRNLTFGGFSDQKKARAPSAKCALNR